MLTHFPNMLKTEVTVAKNTNGNTGKATEEEVATAKKIVKAIKDSGLKVQPQIMDDMIRVSGKKIDDLQAVMALCREQDFELPLQFDNMKS